MWLYEPAQVQRSGGPYKDAQHFPDGRWGLPPQRIPVVSLELGSGQDILLVNLHPDCEDEDTRMEEFRGWKEKAEKILSKESPQVNNYVRPKLKV